MRYLTMARVQSNMEAVTRYLTDGEVAPFELKLRFVQALNVAQRSSIPVELEGIHLEFDDPALLSNLTSRVFTSESRPPDGYLFDSSQRCKIQARIQESFGLIERLDPNLLRLSKLIISTIACLRTMDREGGSTSNFIGLVHLSPSEDWTVTRYAENIVHETVHQCLFLEDMVHSVFPRLEDIESEDTLVPSAILRIPRPIDKSFHAACVAIMLMYFYHRLGEQSREASFLPDLKITVASLMVTDARTRSEGRVYLSESGLYMLKQLRDFCDNQIYSPIVDALSS